MNFGPVAGIDVSKRFSDKLHFPCAGCRQLPLCGLAARKHLALQAVPVQQVYNSSIPKSGRSLYNGINDEYEFMEQMKYGKNNCLWQSIWND